MGLLGVWVLCITSKAAAAPTPPNEGGWAGTVLLRVPRCESGAFRTSEFVRLLEIELVAERLQLEEDRGATDPEFTVEIARGACDSVPHDVVVTLRSKAPLSGLERSIALADVEGATRPRALALAVAELVRETRARSSRVPAGSAVPSAVEAPVSPAPVVASPLAPERAAIPAAPESERVRGQVDVMAEWRIFAPVQSSLWGARFGGAIAPGVRWLRIRADVGALWTSSSDPLGDVSASLYSGALALLLTTTSSPALSLGPRLEVGYARANGTSSRPDVVSAQGSSAVVFTSLAAGALAPLGQRWAGVFEIDLGVSLRGVDARADDRKVASLKGAFAAARAGVAFRY